MSKNWPFITRLPLTPKTLSFTWSGWVNVTVFNENHEFCIWKVRTVLPSVRGWSSSPQPPHLPSVHSPLFFTLHSHAPVLFPSSCESLPALHVPNPNRIPQCKLMQLKRKVTQGTEVTQVLSCYKRTKSHSGNAEVLVMVKLKRKGMWILVHHGNLKI